MTDEVVGPSGVDRVSSDDLGLQVKSLVEQADAWRDRAHLHDVRMVAAMESLAHGWHGGQVGDVMGRLDMVHESVVRQCRQLAVESDDRADVLREAARAVDGRDGVVRTGRGVGSVGWCDSWGRV